MHEQDEIATTDTQTKTARTFGKKLCPECGIEFVATHQRQSFCCVAHKGKFHDRTKSRGQLLVTLGQAWRGGRDLGRSKTPNADRLADIEARDWAFQELCKLLDEFNAEDREAGRPGAVRVIRRQRAMGLRQDATSTKRAARRGA